MKWRKIYNYENYEISNSGRVRSLGSGIEIKPSLQMKSSNNTNPYYGVNLCKKGHRPKRMLIHKLVALHYVPNPGRLDQVDHLDGDKENNWDWNLAWATDEDQKNTNTRLGIKMGRPRKLDATAVDTIIELKQQGRTIRSIAIELGVNKETIRNYLKFNSI